MPVVPKPLATNSSIRIKAWCYLNCEAEATQTAEVVVGAVLPSPLPGSLLRMVVRDTSGQHAVKDDQHRMSHCHDGSLLAATRRQLQEPGTE